MKIIRGRVPSAKKVVVYGPEGIGKSTFASKFPDPVFIDTEGSTKEMDVARFERPTSWQMILDQVGHVRANTDICKTLVIDTIDWAEQMCIEHICAKHQKNGLESFGYGSGYIYVREEFGRFLNSLEDVVEKGINVVLLAHAQLRKFEQPDEMGAYDRWELKLGKKTSSQTSPLVKEWSDALLFANYKTFVVNVDGQGAQKGRNKVQGGKRVMYTTHHSCWDAKNRYGLPDEVPFDYGSIRHILEGPGSVPDKGPAAQEGAIQDKGAASGSGHVQQTAMADDRPKRAGTGSGGSGAAAGAGRKDPKEEKAAPAPADDGRGAVDKGSDTGLDPRIPKGLRDLMIANEVCEWDIQNVVEARGYFPGDMPVADYPADFIDGCLVGAWDKVYGMIREMKANDALVFS